MIERLAGPRTLLDAVRTGAVLVAAVLALAPTTAASATAPTDSAADSVVGRWETTVRSPGKPPTRVVIVFHADHRVELTGQVGAGGEPVWVGTGSWRDTSPTTFGFDLTHPMPAPDGTLLGTVRGHQEGVLSSDGFRTTGDASLDQPDGSTAGPYPVSMTGTRARR
ncbi:hypothetical protein ADK67_28670 [Saccharothrix sp. NRRL B-16348]|uniref:hypothetical protein n=1 Tax=Saccharothrix sp. NRRL B-16348 TaxID=1415542 RepID=UPI0006AFEA7B|nr:hypothetical protein [Saccharothrix sp. NRRL B-16348]KOX21007.1 hypothetical protein ADK67_28670 [Saccharothrix sp. NRRL B-16348]